MRYRGYNLTVVAFAVVDLRDPQADLGLSSGDLPPSSCFEELLLPILEDVFLSFSLPREEDRDLAFFFLLLLERLLVLEGASPWPKEPGRGGE